MLRECKAGFRGARGRCHRSRSTESVRGVCHRCGPASTKRNRSWCPRGVWCCSTARRACACGIACKQIRSKTPPTLLHSFVQSMWYKCNGLGICCLWRHCYVRQRGHAASLRKEDHLAHAAGSGLQSRMSRSHTRELEWLIVFGARIIINSIAGRNCGICLT